MPNQSIEVILPNGQKRTHINKVKSLDDLKADLKQLLGPDPPQDLIMEYKLVNGTDSLPLNSASEYKAFHAFMSFNNVHSLTVHPHVEQESEALQEEVQILKKQTEEAVTKHAAALKTGIQKILYHQLKKKMEGLLTIEEKKEIIARAMTDGIEGGIGADMDDIVGDIAEEFNSIA
ncbi:hypothetical protein WOLCODRAFT_21392 [Wolfiporia cocos MD-104 SS10]|uniref:Uncharacterized protein n=1 Tax=Wolfiporia cocos (strain MD-104) TaxID=742152 RepID=A0A2H3JRE9_WOLCO|nr:hypothetical protein WOLCODRAFT_21392 [Wolfiporia cocos MD-104 SS10]